MKCTTHQDEYLNKSVRVCQSSNKSRRSKLHVQNGQESRSASFGAGLRSALAPGQVQRNYETKQGPDQHLAGRVAQDLLQLDVTDGRVLLEQLLHELQEAHACWPGV